MKIVLVLCWFLVLGVPTVQGGLWQLKLMGNQVTGKNAFLDYAFYGCLCGCDGKGQPLDNTDRCCWAHDCWYGKLEGKCESKLQDYNFSYKVGVVTCTDSDFCMVQNCICDKILVGCFKKHMKSFEPAYKHLPRSKCSEKNLLCPA